MLMWKCDDKVKKKLATKGNDNILKSYLGFFHFSDHLKFCQTGSFGGFKSTCWRGYSGAFRPLSSIILALCFSHCHAERLICIQACTNISSFRNIREFLLPSLFSQSWPGPKSQCVYPPLNSSLSATWQTLGGLSHGLLFWNYSFQPLYHKGMFNVVLQRQFDKFFYLCRETEALKDANAILVPIKALHAQLLLPFPNDGSHQYLNTFREFCLFIILCELLGIVLTGGCLSKILPKQSWWIIVHS